MRFKLFDEALGNDVDSVEKGFSLRLDQKKNKREEHRLGSIRQEQYNYENMVYTGTLWMGSYIFKQDVTLVFDTGSDWLIVEVD